MEDLISRAAMKNMITNHWSDFSNAANYRTALACADAVPTVTPEQPELCEDAVSREDVLAELDEWRVAFDGTGHKESCADMKLVRKSMALLPSARLVPKRGKWIHISEEMWKCDQCGEISCCSPNFCPDCGSDMRQREEQNG